MRGAAEVYTSATAVAPVENPIMNSPSEADARPVRLTELSHGGG